MTAGVWRNEWALPYEVFALTFAAKRAKRRPSRDELGGEDYLVSVTDTSRAARRADRWGTYMTAHAEARI